MASRKRTHSENEKIIPNATVNEEVEATAEKLVKTELSPLIVAIQENNMNIVEQLLKNQNSEQFLKLMDEPMTPLHYASQSGNLEIVKLLFDNGFNKIKPNEEKRETPLHFAVKKSHIEVVKYLLENGFKSELSYQEYHHLIRQCILNDRLEMVKCLLNSAEGINDDAKSRSETLLHYAAADGRLDLLKYLIKCGADIHMKTIAKKISFCYAINARHVDIVAKLLNIKVNKICYDLLINDLTVHLAAVNGNEEIFQMHLKAGFSVKSSFTNQKPIHVAAAFGHQKLISLLIENGVDIDSAADEKTPLHFAIVSGHFSVVKYLLDAGANPKGVSKYTESTVHYVLDEEEWVSKDHDLEVEKQVKILRYLLNYFREDELQSILYSRIESAFYFNAPVELLDVLLECNVEKKLFSSYSYFYGDINSFVHIVDHFEEIDDLYRFIQLASVDSTVKNDSILAEQKMKIIISRFALRLHIAKNLKVVNSSDLNEVFRFVDYYRKVENEISIMKEKIDRDFDATYYDILTKSVDKVANYMRSEKFVQSLESSYKKFSEYAVFLERSIQKGKERKNLIDMSVNCFFNIVEKNYKIQLPNLVIMKIFQLLQVIHLRKLVAACS